LSFKNKYINGIVMDSGSITPSVPY